MQKVLVTSTRWGHISIAKGIKEALEGNYQTEIGYTEIEPFSRISYHFVYKFFPELFRIAFSLSRFDTLRHLFDLFVERTYKDKLESLIVKGKPDIVINIYFEFDSSLKKLKEKYHFKLLNVLADPWTFSKVQISKDVLNITFDSHSLEKLKSFEPNVKATSAGWFMEKKYREMGKIDKKKLRIELNLDKDIFTLCVVSGSEGTFNIFKILRTFLDRKYKMQVIILCGNNSEMFQIVKTLKSISETIHGPKIYGISYTEDMQKYLRAADLVIGKAGPNTMFETAAVLTPFFAISHVAGNEDGNLDIIKRYGIGFVEENPGKAARKLKEIVENPEMLDKFSKNLKILADYNQKSGEKLLKILER
jgi:spore coat polysaccharide biosynthesis predicted glycosyltransferase SpsG